MQDSLKPKPNFQYPRLGAKIKIPGTGFNPNRFGYYVGKNKAGQLILNMDLHNLLSDDESKEKQIELLNVWDNFEVI